MKNQPRKKPVCVEKYLALCDFYIERGSIIRATFVPFTLEPVGFFVTLVLAFSELCSE